MFSFSTQKIKANVKIFIYNKHIIMAGTKLTGHEIDERVDKCIELRYKGNNSIIHKSSSLNRFIIFY